MDPREYRDARWHSLVREAEDLGVPEEQAPDVVARVLSQQRRRIQRADDPDPVVQDALREAVLGRAPSTGRRRWPVAMALVAVLAAAGAVVALTRPAEPPRDHLRDDQVPSMFGFDGPAADRFLRDRGFRVHLQPFHACEVMGRVLTVDPPPGTPYHPGDRITVYTAVPADVACLADYQDRALAWRWIDFAFGRAAAPPFATRVFVYPDDGRRIVLSRREAVDLTSWGSLLSPLRAAASGVSLASERPIWYDVPALRVVPAIEGTGECGVPDPPVAGGSDAIAVLIRPADGRGCPLRVELYRDRADRIEGVALYPGSS